MTAFAIMQEPGPRAGRRYKGLGYVTLPGPLRVGLVEADTEPGALLAWLRQRYPDGHAQLPPHRSEKPR